MVKIFACCRVRDLQARRANAIVFPVYRKEDIPAVQDELIVASQQQCALDLDVPVRHVHTAVARLIRRGLLTTEWQESRSVTKHKLGKGFRAYLANNWVQAFCPVQEENMESSYAGGGDNA